MKQILTALIFISASMTLNFSHAAFAPQTTFAYNMGGKENAEIPQIVIPYSLLGNFFTLVADSGGGATTGNFYRLVKAGSQTTSAENYQVTTGKTLICFGIYLTTHSINTGVTLGYGDTAVTQNNAAAPTNVKYFSAGSTIATIEFVGTTGTYTYKPMIFQFPATKYPFVQAASTPAWGAWLNCTEI